jgi:DnaJ-class molecular chaperone
MPNYEIKLKATGSATTQASPKRINYSAWKCPFCQGKGLNPYGDIGNERCPACHGHMFWEADVVSDLLSSCGRCAGSGRINYMGKWTPCTTCKGSGKV